MLASPKPGKGPTFPQNLCPISIFSTNGKLFDKVILKQSGGTMKMKNLLNASQFAFHTSHSMKMQCMRLKDHDTLNFNNNVPTAVVFFDTEKAFNTMWHIGFIY
jgi:hypothetical protein